MTRQNIISSALTTVIICSHLVPLAIAERGDSYHAVIRQDSIWTLGKAKKRPSGRPRGVCFEKTHIASGQVTRYTFPIPHGDYISSPEKARKLPLGFDIADDCLFIISVTEMLPASPTFGLHKFDLNNSDDLAAMSMNWDDPERPSFGFMSVRPGSPGQPLPLDIAFLVLLSQDSKDLVPNFNLYALNADSYVIYILLEGRMTAWLYLGHDHVGKRLGPHYVQGPSLFGKNEWIRLASFNVEFRGHFDVFYCGKKVYFLTTEGGVYMAAGFDTPILVSPSAQPLVERKDASISLANIHEHFLGDVDSRIHVEKINFVPDPQLCVVDRARNDLIWLGTNEMYSVKMGQEQSLEHSAT